MSEYSIKMDGEEVYTSPSYEMTLLLFNKIIEEFGSSNMIEFYHKNELLKVFSLFYTIL